MLKTLLDADVDKVFFVCAAVLLIVVALCVTAYQITDRRLPGEPFDALEYCLKHTASDDKGDCSPYIRAQPFNRS